MCLLLIFIERKVATNNSLLRMINDKVITAHLVRVDNIISNVTNNELIKQWIGILLFSDNHKR